MKHLYLILTLSLTTILISGQDIVFEFEKVPVRSGFRMKGYWVWGGSIIKVGTTYHLFASRWKKSGPFPEGYRENSEIVRASSEKPEGPYKFEEVIIGERDSSYWDSNMAHNPTIHRIGDEFVLFYIGSDFTTLNKNTRSLLRRVGYAASKSISGPWIRCEKPLIDSESNNPSLLIDNDKIKLVYRDSDLRVWMAESTSYKGPYRIVNSNLWPECKLEDFYMFKTADKYHIICEDNVGGVSGHVRWGVHLVSNDGVKEWKKYDPVVVYDHDIIFDDNSVLHCNRRERPQLLIINNEITHLVNGIYDGMESWCQPVPLKHPVKIQ
jgi:hypothetical protein